MRYLLSFLTALLLFSCAAPTQESTDDTIKVVCTTSIMTDWVSNVATDQMEVIPLLKVGIDPHVYKPSKKDLDLLREADVIIYHGLHLEGKIIEVLEHMDGKIIIDAAKNFPLKGKSSLPRDANPRKPQRLSGLNPVIINTP